MTLEGAMKCDSENDTRIFYIKTYPAIFAIIPYNAVVGFLAKVLSYIITIIWAHRDLFVMNFAFALKLQFMHFNDALLKYRKRVMSNTFWWTQRVHYRKLCSLLSEVDESICAITFLALAVNAFFICVHLFNGL